MAIQRRRRQPARGSGGGTGAANSLDQLMKSIMPMMMMGLQYQQRGREDAASRAARAQEARLGRTFQERMADKRQGWTEDATRTALEQKGREYVGGSIDSTTTPEDIAFAEQQAKAMYGTDAGGPGTGGQWLPMPENRRLQSAVTEIAGWDEGTAADPSALGRVHQQYNLGPMEHVFQGPVQPGEPPLGIETNIGRQLWDAEAGRRQQLEAGIDFEARRAGAIEQAQEEIRQPGREQLVLMSGESSRSNEAFRSFLDHAKPEKVLVGGAGVNDPDGLKYINEQGEMNVLKKGWTGTLFFRTDWTGDYPMITDVIPHVDPSSATATVVAQERKNELGFYPGKPATAAEAEQAFLTADPTATPAKIARDYDQTLIDLAAAAQAAISRAQSRSGGPTARPPIRYPTRRPLYPTRQRPYR